MKNLKYSSFLLFLYSFALVVFSAQEETVLFENLLGVALVAGFILESLFLKKFTIRWHWALWFIVLFAVFSLIMVFPNMEAFRRYITMVLVLLLFYVTFNIIRKTKSIKAVSFGLSFGLLFAIVTSYNDIMLVISGISSERIGGLIGNPNSFAFLLLITAILLMIPVIKRDQLTSFHKYYIVGCVLIYALLILSVTGSRKAIILLVIILLILAYLFTKYQKTLIKVRNLSFLTFCSVYLYIWFSESPYFKRMERLVEFASTGQTTEGSIGVRESMIETAVIMWSDKPIFGWGFDSFKVFTTYGVYSHSNYFELLFNQGLVGFILYYSFFISIIYVGHSVYKRATISNKNIIIWLVSAIALKLIWDLAAVSYYDKASWLFIACVFGSLLNLKERAE